MKKDSININRQRVNSGDKSINYQIGTLNIIKNTQDFSTTEKDILIPLEVANLIYKGVPNNWINIVDLYKNKLKKEKLEPHELLRLIISYDVGRIRKLEDSQNEILFLDTSWLSHNYAHWNQNEDMSIWLNELTVISKIRAKKGFCTSRVFFWKPNEIKSYSILFEIMKTIEKHVFEGIEVYLAEPTDIIHPIDYQIFRKSEGILATDFVKYDLTQLDKVSENDMARELYEIIKKNINNYSTIKISINESMTDILKKIENKCLNLSNKNSTANNKYRAFGK